MKRLILTFTLAMSIVIAAPIVLPQQASQAAADDDIVVGTVVYRKSFPFIIEYTYYHGRWVITNVWYDMSIGF